MENISWLQLLLLALEIRGCWPQLDLGQPAVDRSGCWTSSANGTADGLLLISYTLHVWIVDKSRTRKRRLRKDSGFIRTDFPMQIRLRWVRLVFTTDWCVQFIWPSFHALGWITVCHPRWADCDSNSCWELPSNINCKLFCPNYGTVTANCSVSRRPLLVLHLFPLLSVISVLSAQREIWNRHFGNSSQQWHYPSLIRSDEIVRSCNCWCRWFRVQQPPFLLRI